MSGNSTRTLNIMAFAQRGKHRKDTCPTTVRVVNDVAVDSHLRCALDEYNDTAGRKKTDSASRININYNTLRICKCKHTTHTHSTQPTQLKNEIIYSYSVWFAAFWFLFFVFTSTIHISTDTKFSGAKAS